MRRRTTPFLTVLVALSLLLAGCNNSNSSAGSAGTGSSSSSAASAAPTDTASPGATATSAAVCPSSNTVTFAKTKFVLHAAEGFGAFHRYLYRPFKAGAFTGGGFKSKLVTYAKAGAAALFIKRQVRLMTEDVKGNPTLCRAIAAPLTNLSSTLSDAVSKLKQGDSSALEQANGYISSIEGSSSKDGDAVTENPSATLHG